MCVILIACKGRPTDEVVAACFDQNREGAGAAWRETDDKGVTRVRWVKGISDVKDIQELVRELPIPFITHYRISTVGGGTKKLNHPFVVDPNSPLDLEGLTDKPLLFHNGTWAAWKHNMLEATFKANLKVPDGRWSDSRAMAWLAAHHGLGVLELIDERIAVLTPTETKIFGTGWGLVEGVGYASNLHWTGKVGKGRPFAVGVQPREAESDPEEDAQLPRLIDTRFEPLHDHKPRPRMAEKMDIAIVGGGTTEKVPFDKKTMTYEEACELFAQERMSRNQFKKATSQYFRDLAKKRKQLLAGKLTRTTAEPPPLTH